MTELYQVFKAVTCAMIGVGKKKDLAADFKRAEEKSPWPYIIIGIIMTVVFIFSIILVVNLVLP